MINIFEIVILYNHNWNLPHKVFNHEWENELINFGVSKIYKYMSPPYLQQRISYPLLFSIYLKNWICTFEENNQ